MQEHHNTGAGKCTSAPAKISRRFLMKGLAGAAAVATLPLSASALEVTNPLIAMIAEYGQHIERVEFLDCEVGKLYRLADAVPYPAVWAHEVDAQMYGKAWSKHMGQLDSRFNIDAAFDDGGNWFWHNSEPHIARHQANKAAAKELLQSRQEAREAWELRSGYREIEDEVERLNSRILMLSDAIANYPCECLASVRAKVDFIENQYGGNITPETAMAFFRSMQGRQNC